MTAEITTEVTAAETLVEKVEAELKAELKDVVEKFEHLIHPAAGAVTAIEASATVAGNTTETLAPSAPATVVAPVVPAPAAAPVVNGYRGVPKTNATKSTLLPNGTPRYAADGLTQDWFATHPKK